MAEHNDPRLWMKQWDIWAECLLQFFDSPPAGCPFLHLPQNVHIHTPPLSVQGLQVQWPHCCPVASLCSLSTVAGCYTESRTQVTFGPNRRRRVLGTKLELNKSFGIIMCTTTVNSVCFTNILISIPESIYSAAHQTRFAATQSVPTETKKQKKEACQATPSVCAQDAPAFKKAPATSRRVIRGRHLGDSPTERVSLWK